MKSRTIILLMLIPIWGAAQPVIKHLSYSEYINKVLEGNISYAAEKLNISIADANISASKVFNDPTLEAEYANNDDHKKKMGQGYSISLGKTFTFGKRGAAIDLARSEKEMSAALLEDYFRNLKAEASIAYLEALKQTDLYGVKQSSYNSIKELAEADSIKFSLGKITEVDAMQSRVEEGVMHNELVQAENDLYAACSTLNLYLGVFHTDTLYGTKGKIEREECIQTTEELIQMAIDNRADLMAALKDQEVAKRELVVASSERHQEFDLSVGYNYNTTVRNEVAPAPQFSGMTVGVSMPLKLSNLNKGALNAAKFRVMQAEERYREAKLQVQTEVMKSYKTYNSSLRQVEGFKEGLLDQAAEVLKGKIYSYNRGETSLLEVLDAQRTYNDVKSLYLETIYNLSASFIELERSIGTSINEK